MLSSEISTAAIHASQIPFVTPGEAHSLMTTSLDRFLSLVETLNPEDWSKPTACTEWDVRAILAHQAGAYASGTGYRELLRQFSAKRIPGRLPEDSINALQVAERAGCTPQELIQELRRVGPIAVEKWAYQFRLVKPVPFPHPVGGTRPLSYLFWIIHSRDTWMHRLDICRATGRIFEQTPEHDGRLAALVLRDAGQILQKRLKGHSIEIDLTGVAGGCYQVGTGSPSARVRMDVLDFNIYVSGRFTYDQARLLASISGDIAYAEQALKDLLILF